MVDTLATEIIVWIKGIVSQFIYLHKKVPHVSQQLVSFTCQVKLTFLHFVI